MSSGDTPTVFRCAVVSVVKHAYVPNGVVKHPRFDLVVVCDDEDQPDWVHERNQLYADERGIPYVRNIEQAIAEHDVQVAVISSEAERHCELAVRCAEAGLHVVQDKPMSNRVSECDRVVEAVAEHDVRFMMWNRNFLPALVEAKRVIDGGWIGRPYAFHVDFYFAKDSGPARGSRGPDEPPIDWLERQLEAHADGSDGGVGADPMGELKIEGIYPLAYIQYLSGSRVERVYARTTAHFHQANFDNDVEDLATVTLEMEGGVIGTLCIGRIGAASHPDIGEIKLHVLGESGGLVISEARPEVNVYYRNQPQFEFRGRRMAIDLDYQLMDDFAAAIDSGSGGILDAATSRDIAATVQAAVDSGQSGRGEAVV